MTYSKKLSKIRWGIIGCGDVTEVKSGPAFQKVPNSELVAVMRRNENLAKDYAERHNVPKWYSNALDIIRDPHVDAVYIATPPAYHMKYTVLAASAGKPVYCEKPMGISFNECVQMIQVCKLAQIPLFTAYYRRALPRFLKVKELIESGAIGEIRSVNMSLHIQPSDRDKNSHWRIVPAISGGGYFFDLGSHMLDLIMYFIGPITKVKGSVANLGKLYTVEDYVTANFKFESGAVGSGIWNFVADRNIDETEIMGKHGTITYSTFQNDPIVLKNSEKSENFIIPHPDHVQQPLIQTIVDELLGRSICPSTGESGALTNWVIDKIYGRI